MDERENILSRGRNTINTMSLRYCVVTCASEIHIHDSDGTDRATNPEFMSLEKLSEFIVNIHNTAVVLHTADTHLLTCILTNPRINYIKINTLVYDHDMDLLNNRQITKLLIHQHIDYFISQLAKFEYLKILDINADLNQQQLDNVVAAMQHINITILSICPYLTRSEHVDIPSGLDKLFANTRLQNLCIYFRATDDCIVRPFIPVDWFEHMRTNETITHLGIGLGSSVSQEFIDGFVSAIRGNNYIRCLGLGVASSSFDIKIINAICEHQSIKKFETHGKYHDINSFMQLITHSKLTSLRMHIMPGLLIGQSSAIDKAISNNFNICQLHSVEPFLSARCREYIARNKRLLYHATHKHLVDFAMIFLATSFDPFTIAKIFDEWYEPAGIDYYSARKIATIYGIRNSIDKIQSRIND